MRKIKFRGIAKDTGKWVYGYYIATHLCGVHHVIRQQCGTAEYVDENTVCQCTGLRDKNSLDIYEGDIIKLYDCYNVIVEWEIDKFKYAYDGQFGDVIGNIYENPELLK